MTTYYSGPRVRLPSNRSLELSDVGPSSSSSSPPVPSPTSAPILIFPAPSSEPASPHPHLRSRSLAHELRLRHTRVDSNASLPTTATSDSRARVDSNASSASLVVSDLSSPRFSLVTSPRYSPRFVRSASEWEDLGASPLTPDRVVRLGSARVIPSSWRSTSSPDVELWEWTSTSSEVERDRGWAEDETNYEDALSQFHFPTLEESRWAGEVAERIMLPKAGETRGKAVSHPALGQRTMRLPFRFLLETVLAINPATLMLVERGGHEPGSIAETGLFGTELPDTDDHETESGADRRVFFDVDGTQMVRRALAESLPLMSLESICLVASIPRRVWAGLAMPKWRSFL